MTTTASQSPAAPTAILSSIDSRDIGKDAAGGLIVRAEGFGVSFSAAPSTSNICLVTLQLVNNEQVAVASAEEFELWLSDAATGLGLTATTASGAVASSGTNGTDLVALVAKKMIRSQFDATGKYILSITDTAKTGFYIAVKLGRRPKARVSAQLVTANFG